LAQVGSCRNTVSKHFHILSRQKNMLRILSATVLTTFAQASDVDLHTWEDSDDALSLIQLRATNTLEHSASENPPKQDMVDFLFSYDVPPGWRIGYGLGNRSADPWRLELGQPNMRISHKFVDFKQRSMEECVALVQSNDAICPDANGVTWGMIRWRVSGRGERYMAGYSKKCLCDFCWNPIPDFWISRPYNPANFVEGSAGTAGWITAGPGTLDPSKYSEKRKAAIIKRQDEFCGNMDGWDPLLGMQTTTTTTTQAALEPEDVPEEVLEPEDVAEAVGRSSFEFDFIMRVVYLLNCVQ